MAEPVISVSGLGKRYVIGHEARHDTLRDALAHGAVGALRRLFRRAPARTTEEFWALRDVSFEVNQGDVVGIIGRNGAGKSTLLKILSRITEPTTGSVRLRGRVASLLEVGTGFHPELSGRENIYLNGAILGMSRAEIARKFDEIVAFAEVERFLDTPVKHYSSGMYVRLAFAVAAHLEPEILIVDEVLAVGDSQFQQKCLGKMESIARTGGRTVLFVSHNIGAITRLCSRALLLDCGAVRGKGNVTAVVSQHVSAGRSASGLVELGPEGRTPGAPLRLISLTFNQGGPLINGGPLEVAVRFRADRPLEAGFGLGLCNLEGRRVVTFESDYCGALLRIAQSGEHIVTLRLPALHLIPGRYRIDTGAYGPGHDSHHYVPDCCVVDVLPGPSTPAHWHGAPGDWRPVGDWHQQPA